MGYDATVPEVALDMSEYGAVVDVPVTGSDKFQQFIAPVQFLDKVFVVPIVVQRQVSWSRQCRTPSGSAAVAVFFKVVDSLVVVQRQIPMVVHSAVSVHRQGGRRSCVHAAAGSSCPFGQSKFPDQFLDKLRWL